MPTGKTACDAKLIGASPIAFRARNWKRAVVYVVVLDMSSEYANFCDHPERLFEGRVIKLPYLKFVLWHLKEELEKMT